MSNIVISDNVLITEHFPTYRSYTTDLSSFSPERHYLYFPYVVYIIRKHMTYGGFNKKSLHIGFRKEPLPKERRDILNSTILFPLFSNVFAANNLLACSSPNIAWPDYELRKYLDLSFESWAKMSPDDVMNLLDKWPDRFGRLNVKAKFKIEEVVSVGITAYSLDHVNGLSDYYRK